MNLDDLTLGQLKEVKAMCGASPAKTGNPYAKYIDLPVFIRTVTMYYCGRLKAVYDQELVLEKCSWIADTGRFYDALKNGSLKEVEPYPTNEVIIGRGAILDVCEWGHAIPQEQK